MPDQEKVALLRSALANDGLDGGLRYLNSLTPHRFTGIFLATGESFSTSNSMEDDRVRDRAARESVRAYCGVPLLDSEGHVLGTLCHFDFVAQSADLVDIELMLEMPGVIAPYLPKSNGR